MEFAVLRYMCMWQRSLFSKTDQIECSDDWKRNVSTPVAQDLCCLLTIQYDDLMSGINIETMIKREGD